MSSSQSIELGLDFVEISEEDAGRLMREAGVDRVVTVKDCGADLCIALRDERVLAYWAGSDYGPSYWWAWGDV
jgi:hypothetical protein